MEAFYVFLLLFLYGGVQDRRRRPPSGILSVCESPERLHGLENVSIDTVVRSKRVKLPAWVNYPFLKVEKLLNVKGTCCGKIIGKRSPERMWNKVCSQRCTSTCPVTIFNQTKPNTVPYCRYGANVHHHHQ